VKFISSKDKGDIFIFGVPYDASTCFYPGTRFGPNKIREMSYNLETFSPIFFEDLENINFVDEKDLDIELINPEDLFKKVYEFSKSKLKSYRKGILLGGDHSSPIGFIKAIKEKYEDILVIHFDAHADLRDIYLNSKYSHACFARRVLEFDIKILQFGIRSFEKKEYETFYKDNLSFELDEPVFKNGVMYARDWEILKKFLNILKAKYKNFYISLDIDVFDPAFAPGTGTPEAGGINPIDFFNFLKYLKEEKINIVGFDLVEVNPLLDPSNITSALASKIIREVLFLF